MVLNEASDLVSGNHRAHIRFIGYHLKNIFNQFGYWYR
jgi:hypothetical protein